VWVDVRSISPRASNQEDAERVLEELRNKEKNLQAKVKKQPAGQAGKPNQANQKDW